MSGSLIGGTVGAVIGFAVGGPVGAQLGWMAGSIAGSILMPQTGPDLTDLKPQESEYGRPIPIIYSVMAVGGNIIWAADLVKAGDGSGKGGDSATGPTYTANFAVLICESAGDMALGRIWSGPDKRQVYDPAGRTMESGSITFYNGAEDQMPDPTMEAALGAGNVPAYRGYAYVVIKDFDVTKFDGNRIPFLTIEVGRQGTSAPTDLGTVWIDNLFLAPGSGSFVTQFHGSYNGWVQNNQANPPTTVHERITGFYAATDFQLWNDAQDSVVTIPTLMTSFSDPQYRVLNMTTGVSTNHSPLTISANTYGCGACYVANKYCVVFNNGAADGYGYRFTLIDPTTNLETATYQIDAGDTVGIHKIVGQDPAATWCWAIMNNGQVRRFDVTTSSTSTLIGTAPTGFGSDLTSSPTAQYNPYDGHMYVVHRPDGGVYYSSYSNSAAIIDNRYAPSNFFTLNTYPWLFMPAVEGSPASVFVCGTRWLAVDKYIQIDPVSGDVITEHDGAYHGSVEPMIVMWLPTLSRLILVRFGANYAIGSTVYPWDIGFIDGNLAGADASLTGQTLAEVVTDLSLRAGLTEDDIDVTQLTDTVDGYTLASQMAVKDAISALMPAYFFDAVESEGIVKFVKRGGEIAVAIPDEDLGVHSSDQRDYNGDLYQTQRVMDEELPWTYTVTYVLYATKYSAAAKYARKLVGYSLNEESTQFPMVFTDTKAQQVAQVNLHDRWISRLTYSLALGKKYNYLEPTDVIGVGGYTMRITKITQRASGVLDVEAVRDDTDTYTPTVVVTETPGVPTSISTPSLTTLELM
jgi:hypothetical protein